MSRAADHIELEKVLKVALLAAQSASDILRESRKASSISISYKGKTNLVTEYDLRAEEKIVETIKEHFPDHNFLAEEAFSKISPEIYLSPLWVIDPIDGTTNFAHRHLHCSISIAFCFKGIVEVAVVFAPFLDELYTSIRGRGSFLNGEPISVSSTENLKEALIATGFPYEKENIDLLLSRLRSVLLNCREMRRLGAASIDTCWVACGRIDGYYETVSPWDIAAASLIAREAGASVGHLEEQKKDDPIPRDLFSRGFVVANPKLLPKLIEILLSSQ